MKKLSLFTTLSLLLIFATFAQKWEQTYGSSSIDEEAKQLVEHYDKGYLIAGNYIPESSEQHGWLLKTTINGELLWSKIIGEFPDKVLIEDTKSDDFGNIYVFGFLKQAFEHEWPFIVKLDPCGEKLWCKTIVDMEYDFGYFTDAMILDNGDLLGLAYIDGEPQWNIVHLICIDSNGNFKWKKAYATKEDHPNFALNFGRRIQKFDDLYIISGYVYSPYPNGNPNHVYQRPMFIGIDTMFNEQWVVEFGIQNGMLGKAVETIPIDDSTFMGVGRFRHSGPSYDAWAMFYNDQGEEIGYRMFTDEAFANEVAESTFYEVEKINDSVFIGSTGYWIGGYGDTAASGEVIFDTSGVVYNYTVRENLFGNQNLIKTYDNKYVIATNYWYPDNSFDAMLYKVNRKLEQDTIYGGTYNYDSLCPNLPIQSGTIDLSGCGVITAIEDIPSIEDYNKSKKEISIKAFPNPTTAGSITLSFSNTESFQNMEFRCFDVFGKKIHSEKVYQHQAESELNISQLPPGVYFVIVSSSGMAIGECKFIVK